MSFSFGSKKESNQQDTTSKTQSDPWAPAVPYLKDFLAQFGSAGTPGLTKDQKTAYTALKRNAMEGNPWATDQAELATDLYNTGDHSGYVTDAYDTLQSQIGDYASGKYVDPMSNPQMRAMLDMVAGDVQDRVNSQFAAAGRDFSGMNQRSVAEGVTRGQLPILFDQFNRGTEQQIGAARSLYDAGSGTATTLSNLDAARAGIRSMADGAAKNALDAQNYGANTILNLDDQIKGSPYDDLARLSSLLFPAAGLGGTETGTASSTGSSKGTSIGAEANIGKAIGQLLMSDKRSKEDIKRVGSLADGTPIYTYRYKGSDKMQMGPMAQDVEKTTPEAVTDGGPGGMKMVNLDAATKRAAEIVRNRRKGG